MINAVKDDRAGRLRVFKIHVPGFIFATTHNGTLQLLSRIPHAALHSLAILLQAEFQDPAASNPMLFGVEPDGIQVVDRLPKQVLLITKSVDDERIVFHLSPA